MIKDDSTSLMFACVWNWLKGLMITVQHVPRDVLGTFVSSSLVQNQLDKLMRMLLPQIQNAT